MADWLTEAIKSNLEKADPQTPFEELLVREMRKNLAKSESDDWPSSNTPAVAKGLADLKAGKTTLAQDAKDVLGETADEMLDELISTLDSLVSRARKSGGVIMSDADIESYDDDTAWGSILRSQLRARLKSRAQHAQDPAAYRKWLERGDKALRARGRESNEMTDWQEEFGNP